AAPSRAREPDRLRRGRRCRRRRGRGASGTDERWSGGFRSERGAPPARTARGGPGKEGTRMSTLADKYEHDEAAFAEERAVAHVALTLGSLLRAASVTQREL